MAADAAIAQPIVKGGASRFGTICRQTTDCGALPQSAAVLFATSWAIIHVINIVVPHL